MVANFVRSNPDAGEGTPTKPGTGEPGILEPGKGKNTKRRFDCYASEADALDAARMLAQRLDDQDYTASNMTRREAMEYASAVARLRPFKLRVDRAAFVMVEALDLAGDVGMVLEACRQFKVQNQNKTIYPLPIVDAVTDFIATRKSRGASILYVKDLECRLGHFAAACTTKTTVTVGTADVQAWLDGLKLGPQSQINYRRCLITLFEFCKSRGYCRFNPAVETEAIKIRRRGGIPIFTPEEIARLLEAARSNNPDFVPALAIGAFAGIRSAEIERLEWANVHLQERYIEVTAANAKTASRRIVPVQDNLAAWLAAYAHRKGKVWSGGHQGFHQAQQETAAATGTKDQKPVEWRVNGLRHSYASYRYGQIQDAGRLAGEMGNSASVVFSRYRELVRPADAGRWFNVKPESPSNVVALPAAAQA